MKKILKRVLTVLLVLVLVCAVAAGVLFYMYKSSYIGTAAAMEIAMKDAGLEVSQLRSRDAEFERSPYSAWYEIELETHGMEYDYTVDAVTGEILHKSEKPDR